ncbi:hypothetical protein VULLAG_LOCUS15897 [Vulpes lagopus]
MPSTNTPAAFPRRHPARCRAPRVRTSGPAAPEVWAPAARPLPARQRPAPPVCVGTGVGRAEVHERRRGLARRAGCCCAHAAWRRVSSVAGAGEGRATRRLRLCPGRRASPPPPKTKPPSGQATCFAESPHLLAENKQKK